MASPTGSPGGPGRRVAFTPPSETASPANLTKQARQQRAQTHHGAVKFDPTSLKTAKFALRYLALSEEQQNELLQPLASALGISGKPTVTAIFDCVMGNAEQEQKALKVLDQQAPQQQGRRRQRAMSDANMYARQRDQNQLTMAVDAICETLRDEPYILNWLEKYFQGIGRLKPKHENPTEERIAAVRAAFLKIGFEEDWDPVLIEQVKAQIALSSATEKMRDSAQMLCEADKCRRLIPSEALHFATTTTTTPNFSSHGIEAHRLLLQLMCHHIAQSPDKAGNLINSALGTAQQLAERLALEPGGAFTSFHLPSIHPEETQEKAHVLAGAGFYTRCATFECLPQPLPSPDHLQGCDALSLDFSKNTQVFSSATLKAQAHKDFAEYLAQSSSANKIAFKGGEEELAYYLEILKQADTLWVELPKITEAGLKYFKNLPNCRRLILNVTRSTVHDYKRLAQIIRGAPDLEILVINGVCFSLNTFHSKDVWSARLKLLRVAISLKGDVKKGSRSFCLSSLPIPTLALKIHYPSPPPEIIPASADIESGTERRGSRAAKLLAKLDRADINQIEQYKRDLASEKCALEQLLRNLSSREKLQLETTEWPQEFDHLLPGSAKDLSVKCERFVSSQGDPTEQDLEWDLKWNLDKLSWESSTPRPFADWLGTTTSFNLKVKELAFPGNHLSTNDLEALVNELITSGETVRTLNLANNNLSLEALTHLSTLLEKTSLLRLNLADNPLTESRGNQEEEDAEDLPPPLPPERQEAIYATIPEEGASCAMAAPPNSHTEDLYDLPLPGVPDEEELYLTPQTRRDPLPLYGTTDESGDHNKILPVRRHTQDMRVVQRHTPILEETASESDNDEKLYLAPQPQPAVPTLYGTTDEPGDHNEILPFRRHTEDMRVVQRRTPIPEEVTPTSNEKKEKPPTPPPRSRDTAEALYLSTGDVALADFLERIRGNNRLIALNLAGCGWSNAILGVLTKLSPHLLELGIGTKRCTEEDVDAILRALDGTNVRFVTIPVVGDLQKKVAAWNLKRALEDPILS